MEKSLILIKVPAKGNEYVPIGTRIKAPINSNLKNIVGMQKIINLSKRSV